MRRSHTPVLAAIAILILFAPALLTAQKPKSLGDLNKVKERLTSPRDWVQSGSNIFFTRRTVEHGTELWITDGTVAGTRLVKDIVPGAESSTPYSFSPAIGASSEPIVYFIAVTPDAGGELWRSDGTDAGTYMLKDVNPGTNDGVNPIDGAGFLYVYSEPDSPWALFAGSDGTTGNEPWASLGTPGSTNLMEDIFAGAGSSNPFGFAFIDGSIFFTACEDTFGCELYRSDNPSSATRISDINPGSASSYPSGFYETAYGFLFTADDGTIGDELWRYSSGSIGILRDLSSDSADTVIGNFSTLPSGQVVFSGLNVRDANDFDLKLYTTDGSFAGTTVISNAGCIPGGIFASYLSRASSGIRSVNGHQVYPCSELSFDPPIASDIWVSDGTGATTGLLRDIAQGDGSAGVLSLRQGNNALVFAANDGVTGLEPWVTDGTEAGTLMLGDFNPGEAGSFDDDTVDHGFAVLTKHVGATASLLPLTIGTERKYYYTDGSAANTIELFDDSGSGTDDSEPSDFILFKRRVFFAAEDTRAGREIFSARTKGRKSKLTVNINPAGSSTPNSFIRLGKKKMLFIAFSEGYGRELWITNGKRKGTRMLKDLYPGSRSGIGALLPRGRTGKKVFFIGDNGLAGLELWVTNGKSKGTNLVRDIRAGTESSNIASLVAYKGKAFFAAHDGVNGDELWVSDGTDAGTRMVTDLWPGGDSSSPRRLTVAGKQIFFAASTATSGRELYVLDPATLTVSLVKDIHTAGSSNPDEFCVSEGVLFFSASDPTNGEEIWRSDGTDAGTFLVQDVRPGGPSSTPVGITPFVKGEVLFSANDGTNGRELWKAGPQAGSATLVKDIYPGGDASPTNFEKAPRKGLVYFAANTAAEGQELWKTDGTEAGTRLVADLSPGADSSGPEQLFATKKTLFFTAETEATGREPYKVKISKR